MIKTDTLAHGGRGRIAVLMLDNPPVNGLGHALRSGLVEGDAAVTGIIVTGAGRLFCGGADVREFGTPRSTAKPDLRDVLARLFRCTKPVVAALNGAAFGGGLELAMACHYRVADARAQMALPEVNLGLIPGAWGTQMLPRLTGIERATAMVTDGRPVDASAALQAGLVDRVAAGALIDEAAALLAEVAGRAGHPDVRKREPVPPAGDVQAWFAARRAELEQRSPGCPAPLAALECLALALALPFDEAVARERAHFVALMASPESHALRHVFFAERDAARVPDRRPAALRPAVELVAPAAPGPAWTSITAALQKSPTADPDAPRLRVESVSEQTAADGTTRIVHCRFRLSGEEVAVPAAVVVRDGRIVAAGDAAAVAAPAGLPVIHVPDGTILPGLIDLHFHIE
ncbi:MAG TPA: enoyl-CoA hydratase/isomerase family protein, partial [Rhodocyclaceae bacterium]|nr:enoyl-CoA hydratase/isomerase family protein [Rhodocyclaceae bacterium]